MLTENDVVDAVCTYLRARGYRIDRQCTTAQQGEDIVATHGATGRRLIVEAKGGTSSKATTSRFGKPFTGNQARSHVAVALLKAVQLQQMNPSAQVALAIPDDADHGKLVMGIDDGLARLGLAVLLVACDRSVRVVGTLA